MWRFHNIFDNTEYTVELIFLNHCRSFHYLTHILLNIKTADSTVHTPVSVKVFISKFLFVAARRIGKVYVWFSTFP